MTAPAPDGAGGDRRAAAERLVERLRSSGCAGPVLLLAGSDAVARDAPAWAEAFARGGLVHRVRVVSGGATPPTGDEIDDIAAEARNLAASVIAIDGPEAASLAPRIHAAARRPVAVWSGVDGTLALLPAIR